MLNKKLVLGSLAGATLLAGAMIMLPATASAGLMSGTCVNCHTMHDSVDGLDQGVAGQNAQLLKWNGCVGCHNTGNVNAGAKSVDASAPFAPQVGAAATTFNAGGYFNTEATSHDVADMALVMGTYAGSNAPGSATFVRATTAFNCIDCHGEATGGHHSYAAATTARTGVAGSSYRMLQANTTNAAIPAGGGYVANLNVSGSYAYAADTYDAIGMDAFCADCHGNFHTAGGKVAGNMSDGTVWLRHPTGVAPSSATPTPQTYDGTGALPLGDNGTTVLAGANQLVMCISCHNSHGGANNDMLRFDYGAQIANSTSGNGVGCELCHGAK